VKFFRHLTAVVVVVAAIVGLGVLWAHASGGGSGFGQAPSAHAIMRIGQISSGAIRVHSDNGFNLANTGNLIRTCEIEAALAAVVITVSAVQRRHRRMRRSVEVLT
jgi:hypothetical protein